jgi:outer membrane autotransporter protein
MALCATGERVSGAVVDWVNAGGSASWFEPTNWSPSVPTPADDAFVNNGRTALVEGLSTATAANLSINNGGVTVGNIDPGTLTVDGEISVGTVGSPGRLTLNYGTVSVNTLTVGTSGTYSDTPFGTLNLTGTDPTIRMAIGVNVVVNSQVTGTSGLTKAGLGTLTLANNNTYTGGTTISVGTLQVGNGGGSGALGSGDVNNNGTLAFNRNNGSVVGNLITGSGSLRQSGSGTTILTADNTYTGGTSVDAGILQIGNGGTTGSFGTGPVTNNAKLAFNRSDDVTINNLISGTGNLTQMGLGTLILTADNTYSGGTTISNGTLQVGNGGTSGSIGSGNVNNRGNLVFNRSDDITVANQISGTGNFIHAGSGDLTLTGNNTYSGTTTITNGTLRVGDGGTSGSLGTGAVIDNSALVFNRSDTVIANNQISGTGTLTQMGDGTLTLTGNNTYSGTTTISNGTLQVGNGGTSGSLGTGNVVNEGALAFNRSDNIVVSNSVSGSGNLRQAGSGTTTLTADNTYSGGTTISSGTLQVGNGGTTGAIGSGNVTNNATLAFNRSNEIVVSNTISGSGSLRQVGSGTTTLIADNTYTGSTVITNGTLQVGNGGTSGSLGTGNVTNNSRLKFNRSDDITVGNQISGTGSLIQAGDGTTTLTANNTYSGTTVITNGTLQIGDGGTSGSLGTGAVTNDARLVFNRNDSTTVNNLITGTGELVQLGTNTLTLTANNTYNGTTTISNGAVQVGNGGTSGSLGSGNVMNDGTLILNRSDQVVVSNSISGSGNLTKAGAGTAILTEDNSYSGITTISNGTLQVGNDSTTGSLGTGAVTNNGILAFRRSDGIAVSNLISGFGHLVQAGSNTLTLTANNTYTGTTTVSSNSALQVGNGGNTGTLGVAGNVTNNGALVYNRNDEVTVSNRISGTGNFTQAGSGTVILAQNNTYTGITTISNGTLQLGNGGNAGSVASSQIVNLGALLINRSDNINITNVISGTGSLTQAGTNTLTLSASNSYTGGTTIQNGGTLAVQNGALGSGNLNLVNGTLKAGPNGTTNVVFNVANYTQSADGRLDLVVGGTGSNQFNHVVATGTANLDGTLIVRGANGYQAHHNDSLELLSAAGGISGMFDAGLFTNTIAHSALLDGQLVYSTTNVTLDWIQLLFEDFLTESNNIKLTENQRATVRGLDSIINSTDPNDEALIDFLDYLPDLTNDLAPELDRIAPEELTAMMVLSFAAMDSQGQQFLNRVGEIRADYRSMYSATLRPRARSLEAFDKFVNKPWSTYVEVPTHFVNVDSDDNADGYNASVLGVTFGADRRLSEELIVGAALGYAGGSSDLTEGGKVDLKSFNGQLYAIWCQNGVHVEAMAGGGFNSYDTTRQSVDGEAEGSTDGYAWTGLLGGGYDWENGNWKFGPSASVQYTSSSIDSFTEEGSLSPMTIESQSEDALHTQVGFDLRYRHHVFETWTIISPEVYVGWRHDFLGNEISLDTQFASGNGSAFTVTGPELGSDSIVTSLGLSVQWKPSFNTYINFMTLLGRDGYSSISLNAGARVSF